jgi:hypothetical protein
MSGAMRLLPGLLLLAGCVAGPPDSRFDGTYAGASLRARDGGVCGPASEPASLSIQGGTFRYVFPIANVYSGVPLAVAVDVRVAATGAVEGGSQYYADDPFIWQGWRPAWVTVVGQVAGDRLEADVDSLNCGRHLSLRRS